MGDAPRPLDLNAIGTASNDQAEAGGAEEAARVSGFYRRLLKDGIEVTFAQELTSNFLEGLLGRPVIIQEREDADDA